jgi:hypothetical protein
VVLLGARESAELSNAHQRIVIAKCGGMPAPLVAWAVVRPSPVVCVSWAEEYGVFAARVPARAGSLVTVDIARYPASDRTTYRYRDGAFEPIGPLEPGIPQRHYGVQNVSGQTMAFGLLQCVTEDTAVPVSFTVLSPGVPADLVPDDDIAVWSDATTAAGTVISDLPARALVVPALGQRWLCCCYDANTNAFTWIGGR